MSRIFSFFLFLLPVFLQGQCLNGNYTIGGASPDYTTISSAVSALQMNGVCGPVVFNVRSGTYSEQISIPAITGTSLVNTVTFQSEVLDSSQVLLSYTPISASSYVLRLAASSFITFRAITIQDLSTTYLPDVQLTGACTNVHFINCRIIAPLNTVTGVGKSLIYYSSTTADKIFVTGCSLIGGTHAIAVSNGYVTTSRIYIDHNEIHDQVENAIYIVNTTAPQITRNNISSSTAYATYKAILLSGCMDSIRISCNTIVTHYAGISLSSCSGNNPVDPIYITNNFMSGSGVGAMLDFYAVNNTEVYFNTISMNTGVGGCLFNNYSPIWDNIYNNIFYNSGAGTVYGTGGSLGNYHMDYNIVYSASSSFAFTVPLYYYPDFVTWQTMTGKDIHSVYAIPQFISSSDLHVASDFSLNMPCYTPTHIASDIDGEPRSMSLPFPGADEFYRAPTHNDMGTIGIHSIDNGLCQGSSQVSATIKNFGEDTLYTATVEWSVNATPQASYNWVGSLFPGDTLQFNLGTFLSPPADTFLIKSNTHLPNGFNDGNTLNDSLGTSNAIASLSGSYTIGGPSPDYPTFTSALNAMHTFGICGPVTFLVRDGIYNEQLLMQDVQGTSAVNTIRFTSENNNSSLVTIQNAASGYTIWLYRSRFLTIDHITIHQINTSNTTAVRIGQTYSSALRNCVFQSDFAGSNEPNGSVVIAQNSCDSLLVIDSCTVIGGYCGMSLDGNTQPDGFQNTLSHNNFVGQTHMGIGIHHQMYIVLSNNVLQDTTSMLDYCVFIQHIHGGISVAGNKIYGHHFKGIFLDDCTGTGVFTNNMISLGQLPTNTPYIRSGFRMSNCTNLKFYFNSVYMFSTGNNNSDVCLACSSDTLTMFNNSFYSRGIGKALVISTPMPAVLTSDYNNFKSENGASILGGDYYCPALSDWLSVSGGNDLHSLSLYPGYYSDFDLHSNEPAIRNSGYAIAQFTTDIDSEVRSNPPDIGADESNGTVNDVGVYSTGLASPLCAGSQSIPVIVRNYGTSSVSSFQLNYSINSIVQTPINWNGTLNSGNSVIVPSGIFNFVSGQSYDIVAWTSQPNSSADGFVMNDTSYSSFAGTGMSGTYTIGGASPDYTSISDAINDLDQFGACGSVEFLIRNGTYAEQSIIRSVAFASETDSVVFRSQSNDSSLVRWVYSSSNLDPTLRLENVRHLRFRNLTIEGTGSDSRGAVIIWNNCTDVIFSNCQLKSTVNPLSTGYIIYVEEYAYGKIDDLVFSNNHIVGGTYGFGNDGSIERHAHVCFLENTFESQTMASIKMAFIDSSVISGNLIKNQLGTTTWHGIDLGLTGAEMKIVNNRLLNCPGVGITLVNGNGAPTSPVLISNNFITTTTVGIWMPDTSYATIDFNTIRVYGNSYDIIGVYGNYSLYGNILYNSINNHCLFTTTSSVISSDFNVFHGSDSFLVYFNNQQTLQAWINSTGFDSHSIIALPVFADTLDPHLSNSNTIENFIPMNPLVLTDIDGESRMPLTDPGCDENLYSASGSYVFPGNANNDTIVDALDPLVTGLYFGTTGPSRAIQGNSWIPYVAADWTLSETNGQNLKHGDCNGDGIIDYLDTVAISQNFGLTEFYPIAPYVGNNQQRSGTPVYIRFSGAAYAPGSWVDADIIVSDSIVGSIDLYGLAVHTSIPSAYVEPGTMQIYPVNSWLLSTGVNGFGLGHSNASGGEAQIVVTRIDHTNANGFGTVAKLRFRIPLSISQLDSVTAIFVSDTAILANGNGIPIFAINSGFVIDPELGIGAHNENKFIHVFPVPATESCFVQFMLPEDGKCTVELKDAVGRIVYLRNYSGLHAGEQKIEIPLSGIAEGIYFVNVTAAGITEMIPEIVQKK